MGNNWVYKPLGEVVSIQRGHDLPSQSRKSGNVPIMGSSGLTGYHDTAKQTGPGVVVGRSGNSMGVVSFCKDDFWPLNTCLYVTDFKGNDERYIYYLLQQIDFDQFNSGSAQKSLNRNLVYPYKVYMTTDKHEQKIISDHLSILEDKIELNRQTNQTLESMAQAMFKSWFVDFDPVIDNALAAGNPIPNPLQKRAEIRQALRNSGEAKSLPAHIQKLFPDSFRLSDEMGWVPSGWEIKPVSAAITVNPKVTLTKGTVAPFVDMKALPTRGFSVLYTEEKAYTGGAKFKSNDILLARITPCLQNGKTALVDFLSTDEVGFGSTEFIVLRGKQHVGYTFVACLSRDPIFRKHCCQSMVGSSGRQRVQNSCFDDYFLALPRGQNILGLFEDMNKSAFNKISINKEATYSLSKLRDTLLPKLISGELRIPEVEAQIQEAVA